MKAMRRTTSVLLLITSLATGSAGCSFTRSAGEAMPSASASADRGQILAVAQEWVDCLRGKGLTRMPDPQLNSDGYLEFPAGDGYDWKNDLRGRSAIVEACKAIEDRYPPNAFRPKAQFSAEDLRKLAEFAKCVRGHGLPDFPDPDAEGTFDLGGTPLANGIPAAKKDQATQACRHIWSGDIRTTGQNGGKK